MYGAIIGDIVGSRFERQNIKTKRFELFATGCRFTDDSVTTVAVFHALKLCAGDCSRLSDVVVRCFQAYGRANPNSRWGGHFRTWMTHPNPKPYGSWGNGAAMRVSPCAWFGRTLDEVKDLAYKVTCVTHNHPEGLKGAEATAVAVFLARTGHDMASIKAVLDTYYRVDFTLEAIRPTYTFHGSCQNTVPFALACFYESVSYEDAVRNAISIGGDSDTLGAITGSIAEAYWGIPAEFVERANGYMGWAQNLAYPAASRGCGRVGVKGLFE